MLMELIVAATIMSILTMMALPLAQLTIKREKEKELLRAAWEMRYAIRGWTPKSYKEREIPIHAKLAKSLKAWKAKSNKTCTLVFPTGGCNPKLDFLDCLKAVVERA